VNAGYTLTATADQAGTINFKVDGTTISGCGTKSLTLVSGVWTATCTTGVFGLAGDHTFSATYSPADSTDYVASAPTAITETIVKSTTTISFTGGTGLTYNGTAGAIDISANTAGTAVVHWCDDAGTPNCFQSAGLTVVLDNTAQAYVYTYNWTPPHAGNWTVSVSFTPDDTDGWTTPDNASANVTVAKTAQTVTVTPGSDSVTLSATGPNTYDLGALSVAHQGTVSFSVASGLGCSITGGTTLHFAHAGDCVITVTGGTTVNYLEGTDTFTLQGCLLFA
jgi:hypothetical protein